MSSLFVTCLNIHKAKELHSSACSEILGLYTESTVKQLLVTGTELSTPANSERPSDNGHTRKQQANMAMGNPVYKMMVLMRKSSIIHGFSIAMFDRQWVDSTT